MLRETTGPHYEVFDCGHPFGDFGPLTDRASPNGDVLYGAAPLHLYVLALTPFVVTDVLVLPTQVLRLGIRNSDLGIF